MSTIHVLEISDIKCSGLRSADFLSKNDVYVVFKVGTKKCKTKYIPGSGKNVRFPETLVMNLSDADMAQGVDMERKKRVALGARFVRRRRLKADVSH